MTNHVFDFSTIKQASFIDGDIKYNIAICKHDDNCPDEDSAACKSYKDESPVSIGKVSDDVIYSNGGLSLTYTDGAQCNTKTGLNYSTIIQFHCDEKFDGIQDASLLALSNGGCTRHVIVRTKLACEPKAECVVQNSELDTIDLTGLIPAHGHDYVQNVPEEIGSIYLNLCSPLNPINGITCPPGSVVCLLHPGNDKAISLGNFDPTREWDWPMGAQPSIIYNSTDHCTKDDSSPGFYSTKINLICEPYATRGYPSLMGIVDCVYMIDWASSVACKADEIESNPIIEEETLENCIFDQGNIFADFNKASEFNFKDDQSEFKMNLCGNGVDGCPGGAVCRKINDKWVNLGSTKHIKGEKDLELAQSIVLELQISHGDKCDNGGDKSLGDTYNTVIWLSCGPDTNTAPIVVSTGTCHTILSWSTSLVCQDQVQSTDDDDSSLVTPGVENVCLIETPSGRGYNLSPLQRVSGHWDVHFESQNLILNPCGVVHDTVLGSDCEGAVACAKLSHMKKWAPVSELSKPEIEEPASRNGDVGGFTLTYAKGSSDACPFDRKDVSAKLEITFKCGKTLGKPKPLEDGLISKYDCT